MSIKIKIVCNIVTKNKKLEGAYSSIFVYHFLQHAQHFFSTWMTSRTHIKKKSGVMKTSLKQDVDSDDDYTPAPYPLVYSGYSQNRRVLESLRGKVPEYKMCHVLRYPLWILAAEFQKLQLPQVKFRSPKGQQKGTILLSPFYHPSGLKHVHLIFNFVSVARRKFNNFR